MPRWIPVQEPEMRAFWDGQTAIIEAVEQDVERKIHLAVVFENDPGKDLGLSKPGHRFFYGVEEVEPIQTEAG